MSSPRLFLLLFLTLACRLAANPSTLPNIIFILTDDLGYGELSCYGQRRYETPHIDRLAAEGVRFTQAYSGSPICAPSRATLMTGRHTGHVSVRNNFGMRDGRTGLRIPLQPEETTVAQLLHGAGYHTALIGKWGLGEEGSDQEPWNRGFDFFYGYVNQAHAHNQYPEFLYRNSHKEAIVPNYSHQERVFSNDRFCEEALEWIGQVSDQRPFFLYLALTTPHADLKCPPDSIEAVKRRESIIVTEVPYQSNPGKLVQDIAELVREQKLTGISELRNESDRDGIRIVIGLKRDAIPRVVLNQLYKHTSMQSTFGVIMLALVPDPNTRQLVPKVLTLKQCLEHYIAHRHEVIIRRTQFDLDKALEREHILEGLKIAVDNIDEVIKLIRAADDTPTASTQLQARFGLSERQAEAILNMRLAKLTGLERDKLEEELAEVRAFIIDMRGILESRTRRMDILKGELMALSESFGDDRRTEIVSDDGEFSIEDLIADEEMVVTISHNGYIKRTPASLYKKQGRGGRGKSGADLKENDFIERLYVASTHTYMLIFTDDGRCYWLKVHELPQAGRATRGKPIVNLINVTPDTRIRAIVVTREFSDTEFLLFCTKNGTVKKSALSQYSNPRSSGIKAIKIEDGDELVDVQVTAGNNDVVLATRHGLSLRFHESDVREMGRDTTGVKGIELRPSDLVVGMVVIKREATLLVVTEKGLGKCSEVSEYRVQKRGGKGILTLNRTVKTGDVVALMEVVPEDELMLMTRQGIAIRSKVSEIRVTGRAAQGVKLVALDENDVVSAVARVIPDDKDDGIDAGDVDGAADVSDAGESE